MNRRDFTAAPIGRAPLFRDPKAMPLGPVVGVGRHPFDDLALPSGSRVGDGNELGRTSVIESITRKRDRKQSAELPRWLLDSIAAVPRAGEGIHKWIFRMARQLWPHRERANIIALLNQAVCDRGRTVPAREVEAAVDSAKACAWQPGASRGGLTLSATPRAWPQVNQAARAEIVKAGGLADLWEASPVRVETTEPQTENIVDLLFPGNPLLCCGASSYAFDTQTRESWRGEMSALQFIVPSPMSSVEGVTKDGKPSRHTLSNTGTRRFLVVEFDTGAMDEHAALLLHLASGSPLVLAVHSGGKSLHGWFYCADQPEERLRRFMESAVRLGADPATWTRSQFVRMPDGTRDNGTHQTVFFLNPRPLEISR